MLGPWEKYSTWIAALVAVKPGLRTIRMPDEELEYDKDELEALVLATYLSGITGAMAIARALKRPELHRVVDNIMRASGFMTKAHLAKKDMASSVIDTIKVRLHRYLAKMEDLALEAQDPRVQFQALKDLLDRGGTGAAKQISLTSPQAYRRVLDEFKEDKDETATDSPAKSEPDSGKPS